MKQHLKWLAVLFLALTGCSGEDASRIRLQADWFIGDHMVLQRDHEIVITGAATSGLEVAVRLGDSSAVSTAGANDRFLVRLPSRAATTKSVRLRIRCDEQELTFEDIVIGDVWLLAGGVGIEPNQPSQVRVCRRVGNWTTEKRSLTQAEMTRITDSEFLESTWKPAATAAPLTSGAWLAFGKTLSEDLDLPIGLIDVSCPGSALEGWVPKEQLAEDRVLQSLAAEFPESPLTQVSVRGLVRSQLREWILAGRKSPRPQHYLEPGYLYSAVIEGLAPFPLCGVAWQMTDETTHEPQVAERITRLLIASWRKCFNESEMRFVFQELPATEDSRAPLYREGQRALRDLGGVYIATAYDLEQGAAHQFGERLARADSAPQWLGLEQSNGSLVIQLAAAVQLHWRAGLTGSGFEIAGESLRFLPAQATLIENGVRLHAREVPNPIAARYAWSPAPLATLQNEEGVPLAPFRTHPVTPIKIACIGDSLTFGFGLRDAAADAYPVRLAELLGDRFLVRNFSRSATTAAGTRFPGAWNPVFCETREYGQALAFEPDVIICNLGTNDLTHWWTSGADRAVQFEAEYADLLDAFKEQEREPKIFLWSPIAPLYPGQANYGDAREAELNESLSRMAVRIGAQQIDLHESCSERPEWFPDKLHPNPAGCRAIAAAVHAQFGSELLGVPVPPAKPLRLFCVQARPNWSGGLPAQKSHAADTKRLAFRSRLASPDQLILGRLAESPRLRELGRALWDGGLRNFAMLPFDGDADALAHRLAEVERELPRNEMTRVVALLASAPKLKQVIGCQDAVSLAPSQFASPKVLVDHLLELLE